MREVKDEADQTCAHQGAELDYNQYSNLILSAFGNYDAQFVPLNAKVSRKACDSEIGDNNFYKDSPSEVTEECNFNADSLASLLLVNMTETNISFLLPEDFKRLTCEHRELRGKIPRDMKSVMLNSKGSEANLVSSCSKGNSNNNSKSSYKNLNLLLIAMNQSLELICIKF